ncbi:unnamed protein product [Dibothriocephalus latus]|uniref:Uncharacterized protein n=1 Tax=Dibothriocephalus latus TaxID=60516 RepID=A0A3P7R481_DIBLA|nr:unnamed protein product [Dibothriocephalus latus]
MAYLQALIAYYTGKPIIRDCERIEEAEEEEEEGPENGDQEDVWEVPRIVVCPPSTDELSIFCEPAAPAWNQTRSSVMAGTETEDMKGALDSKLIPYARYQPPVTAWVSISAGDSGIISRPCVRRNWW